MTFGQRIYYGSFTSSCPDGFSLLSCGFDNSKFTDALDLRSAYPVNSTTCGCEDPSGFNCLAWCTGSIKVGRWVKWTALKPEVMGSIPARCSASSILFPLHVKKLSMVWDKLWCQIYSGFWGSKINKSWKYFFLSKANQLTLYAHATQEEHLNALISLFSWLVMGLTLNRREQQAL